MTTDGTLQVGIVGAGAMGLPTIRHIVGARFHVSCCDTDPARRQVARQTGASATGSIADLRDCSVVLVFVPTDDDVRRVADGYLAVAHPGSTMIICTSAQPQTCIDVGKMAEDQSVSVLDAALTGGIRGANDGTINLLVGGDARVLADVMPVLVPWTNKVHHLGALGMGQVGKTVNNLIHWGQIVVIAESLSFGARLGVPVTTMREALIGGSVDSRTLRELEDMRFTWYEKDIDNAKIMAEQMSTNIPVAEYMQRCMRHVTVDAMADLLTDKSTIDVDPEHEQIAG